MGTVTGFECFFATRARCVILLDRNIFDRLLLHVKLNNFDVDLRFQGAKHSGEILHISLKHPFN